jgi:hypothetical protein
VPGDDRPLDEQVFVGVGFTVTSVEDLERRRRSIVMLPPGTPALVREDAMALLSELIELRRWADDKPDHPPPGSRPPRS